MDAIGLKSSQPTYHGNLLRGLLGAVVLAAVVTVLIVATAGRVGLANPVAAPAPNALGFDAQERAMIEFRASERAAYAAMIADLEQKAEIQIRADERAVLTPSEEAAAVREATRQLHLAERSFREESATSNGLADYYTSTRDANNAWTKGVSGNGGKFAK